MPTALPLPVSGLETRLRIPVGTLADADLAAATQYIADATAFALAEVPTITALEWQDACPDVVVTIIYKAARREWENPSGLSQEISGEHTITTAATSGVFLTAAEVAQIRRAAGLTKSFLGSVRVPHIDAWAEQTQEIQDAYDSQP